jgi:streptogramin lyase
MNSIDENYALNNFSFPLTTSQKGQNPPHTIKNPLPLIILLTLFLNLSPAQPKEWIFYTASSNIRCLAQENEYLWIGTENGGLVKLNMKTGTFVIYNKWNSALPDNSIWSIAIDKDKNKWIGTSEGLVKFDGKNWTVYNTSNSALPDNCILSIAIDKFSNKWIGTSFGLAKFDDKKWTIYNEQNSKLPSNEVRTIAIDAKNNKWIGTPEGLAKFDGTNWTIFNTYNSKLPSNNILAISIDPQGNKWIVTYEGLANFNDIKWITLDTSNSNLPSKSVNAIAIDEQGNKWIGTYGGLALYLENKDKSIATIDKKVEKIDLPQNDLILLGRFEKDILEPLFTYQNGTFKGASIVDENPDVDKSILTQFEKLHLYSNYGEYLGQIDVNELTTIEVGCVKEVVGKFKNTKPKDHGYFLNLPIPQKNFYKGAKFSRNDTILSLNHALSIVNEFISSNSLNLRVKSFEIQRLVKFDANSDGEFEIFAKIKAKPQNEEENGYIITSFIISSNKIAFSSTTYIDPVGLPKAGDYYTIDFEFACDIDADSIAEIVVIVGYYESYDYQILKFYKNKFIKVASTSGGGC